MLARLREEKMYSDALIVVIADHGISFVPSEPSRGGLSRASLPGIASVPFLIQYPGQTRGRIDDRAVEVTDLLPTIVDVLGIDPGWRFDGKSLLRRITRTTRSIRSFDGTEMSIPINIAEQVRATARRKFDFLGLPIRARNDLDAFFAVGTYRGFVGQRLSSLDVRGAPRASFRIEDAGAYRSVDRDALVVPAAITAFATTGSPDRPIAVVVNKYIAQVVTPVRWQGETRIDAVFSPRFLKRTANHIELFELEGGRLRPIEIV